MNPIHKNLEPYIHDSKYEYDEMSSINQLMNYRINWLHKLLDQKSFPRPITVIVNEYLGEDFTHLKLKKIKMTTCEEISIFVFSLFCCKAHRYYLNPALNESLKKEDFEGIARICNLERPLHTKIDDIYLLELARQKKIDSLSIIAQNAKIDMKGRWTSSYESQHVSFESKFTLDWSNDNSDSNGIAFINSLSKALFTGSRQIQFSLLAAFLKYHLNEFKKSKTSYRDHISTVSFFSISYLGKFPLFLLHVYMLKAIRNNEIDIFQLFLKFGLNVESYKCHYIFPIPGVLERKYIKLDYPFSEGSEYSPVLNHAIFHPDVSLITVAFWLKQGLSPDMLIDHSTHKINLLIFAIWRKDRPLIKLLLANNADPYFPCTIHGEIITPIQFASMIDEYYPVDPSLSTYMLYQMNLEKDVLS